MRTLRLFLYFLAISGLLLGIAQCVGLALGGATTDHLLGNGFVLLALGLGARYQSAGFVPLRASFALLGLAGALPLLAGFAPLGAAFAVFLFLPLRATGARLSAAVGSLGAGPSLLAIGAYCAWLLTMAWAPGLPGFLLFWLVAGLLQRISVPVGDPKSLSPPPDPAVVFPALLASAGMVLLFLFFSPYLAVLDSGALPQDLRRGLALGIVFFSCWLTIGSGFAETRLRLFVAAASSCAVALLVPTFTSWLQNLSTNEGYRRWLKTPSWEWVSEIDAPVIPEEHLLYAPFAAWVAFAVPCAVLALLLRNLIRTDSPGPGPNALSPILGGAGVALLACGILASGPLVPHLGTLAALFLLAAGLYLWWQASSHPLLRWGGVGIALLLSGFFLRPSERPILQHPLIDAMAWSPVVAEGNQAWHEGAVLQDHGFFSMPRFLQRQASQLGEGRTTRILFDGRNHLGVPDAVAAARRAELLLANTLASSPKKICWVGIPDPGMASTLLEDPEVELSLACDPPALARMALVDFPEREFTVRRSLANSDGPFDMILMHSAAMWQKRHSLLRSELLRQASVRLKKDGVCIFLAGPEDFVPGLLPQWIEEFRGTFAQTSVFLLPDGMQHARFLIAGRRSQEEGSAWPLPQGLRAEELERLGLPLFDADDLASLEIQFQEPLGAGRPWTFRGPFRPADAALADTAFRLIAETSVAQRSAAVCAELLAYEAPGHASLLGFYAAQFDAQEYSVHDTYFDGNPFATETSAQALDMLLRTAAEFPDAAPIHRTWAEVGVTLVEAREVAWIDTYFTKLREDLHWEDPEVHLALAHAALEMLDFEGALSHLDAILSQYPNFLPAKELKALAEQELQVPRDTHAGHDH